MGCGASQKVAPYHGVAPPMPSKKPTPVSEVAPVQDFTSLATLMEACWQIQQMIEEN